MEQKIVMLDILCNGIIELKLTPDDAKVNKLLSYMELLKKWNKTYSLTSIVDLEQMIIYHLLDGLTTISYINEFDSIIDIGSGMGVPGVIIAIWCPDKKVSLLDSNHKKIAFLKQVVIELGLSNVDVICSRVEKYIPIVPYDLAISRAFSNGKLFIDLAKHLVKGVLMLMKSVKIDNETYQILSYKYNIIELNLPFCVDKRYLLEIEV